MSRDAHGVARSVSGQCPALPAARSGLCSTGSHYGAGPFLSCITEECRAVLTGRRQPAEEDPDQGRVNQPLFPSCPSFPRARAVSPPECRAVLANPSSLLVPLLLFVLYGCTARTGPYPPPVRLYVKQTLSSSLSSSNRLPTLSPPTSTPKNTKQKFGPKRCP